jgi:hypothetical protein
MPTRKEHESTVWTRLSGVSLTPPNVTPATAQAPAGSAPNVPTPAMFRRWRWRLLNGVAIVVWIYVLTKLFVMDVDRVLLTAVAPSALPILDYRIVFFLVVIGIVFWRRWVLEALYVAALPLLVLFVWIPWHLVWFFWRHRSWGVFLGMLQVAATLFRDIRYNVITKSFALAAAILIITTGPSPLLWICLAYIAWLMVWSFWRRIRGIFTAPSFIVLQERFITRMMNWGWLQRAQLLKEELKATGIERYDETQAQSVTAAISLGIGVNKALYLYAYQLGRYRRRYSPSVLFNLVTVVWVFVAALTGLTLLNVALLKLAPDQYMTGQSWGAISPIVYTLSTFWLAEAGGIHPVGQLAYLLQLAGALTGGLIIASLGLSVVMGYLRERDDTAFDQLVLDLKEQARQQEERFKAEYAVTVDEAYERLRELRANAVGILTFLIQSFPSSPPEEGGTATSA